ncbi:MAG: RHS repeat-associated core domain-containing protein, partial [Planctomycetaceae bacterium]|nr:RHS repeat-associated core domain-containing protein [Planctomycetaceae bacterium]
GSTRVLTDLAGAIVELYSFDAYGNAIGFDPSVALTEFLYSGEQFDSKIGQQYLRQRYYDPVTGRFNRLDPFFGNLSDPLSLHKYLYVHADPVNMIDPNGLFGGVIGIGISMAIGMGNQSRGTAANLGAYYRIYNQFVQPLIDLKDAVIGTYNSVYAGYQFLAQEAGEYIYSAIMQSGLSLGSGGQKRFVYSIPKKEKLWAQSEIVVTVGGTVDGNLTTGTASAAFAVSVEFRMKLNEIKRLHASPILTIASTGKYVLSNGSKNGWQDLRINASGALRWEYHPFKEMNLFAEIGVRGGADYSFQRGFTNHTASIFGRICKDIDFIKKDDAFTQPSNSSESLHNNFKVAQRITYFQFRYGTGEYVDDIF